MKKIPLRMVMVIMASLATAIQYTIRMNLNVTIVAMVNNSKAEMISSSLSLDNYTKAQSLLACPVNAADDYLNAETFSLNAVDVEGEQLKGEKYDWSPSVQGIVLGGFYYGYILTHIHAGQFSLMFGSKKLILISLLASSLLTLITPFVASWHVAYIIAIRVFTGMTQGVLSPAIYTLFANWIPVAERSTALSLITIGGNVGAVVIMPLSGYLCKKGNFFDLIEGWPLVFYSLGISGLIFTFFWQIIVTDFPKCSEQSIQSVSEVVQPAKLKTKKAPHVHWTAMLCSSQLWVVAIAKFCVSWSYIAILSKLPAYLESMLHMPLQLNSLINAYVYVAACVSSLAFGWLSDFLLKKNILSRLVSRKIFESIALFGSGGALLFIPWAGCNIIQVIILLVLSNVAYAAIAGGDSPIVMDLAPDHSGTLYGITNAVASTPGFVGPVVVGLLLDHNESLVMWNYIFFISGSIAFFGGFVFLLFASVDAQPWGVAKKEIMQIA